MAERIVNLVELAFVLGLSDKALQEKIRRSPDFPIEERGSNGVPYKFDLDQVKAWVAEDKRKVSAAEQERRSQLQLWQAEVYGEQPDADADLSPAARKALADAIRTEDFNRSRRRELIESAPLESKLVSALVKLRQGLMEVPGECAKRCGLERAVRIELERMIEVRLNELSATLGEVQNHGDTVDQAA